MWGSTLCSLRDILSSTTEKPEMTNRSQSKVQSEWRTQVEDANVCTAPIKADYDILELVQCSKNTIDHENEMNNSAPLFPRHPK
ncbi:hypothetical protein TNCV_536651 [Trichonephila clavipes]|nr:hypothetical protein TNCV_536651 [Trichonephila clavipes]